MFDGLLNLWELYHLALVLQICVCYLAILFHLLCFLDDLGSVGNKHRHLWPVGHKQSRYTWGMHRRFSVYGYVNLLRRPTNHRLMPFNFRRVHLKHDSMTDSLLIFSNQTRWASITVIHVAWCGHLFRPDKLFFLLVPLNQEEVRIFPWKIL